MLQGQLHEGLQPCSVAIAGFVDLSPTSISGEPTFGRWWNW